MELIVETSLLDDIKLKENITKAQETAEEAYSTATKAVSIAGNNDQYFWTTQTGTDTGVHITLVSQETFKANPRGANLLVRNNGVAIRDGLLEVAVFNQSGTFYNSYVGNQWQQVAAYTSTYMQIGATVSGRYNVRIDASGTAADNGFFVRNGTINLSKYSSDGVIFYDGTSNNYELAKFASTGMTLKNNSNYKVAEFLTNSLATGTTFTIYDGSSSQNVLLQMAQNGGSPYFQVGKNASGKEYIQLAQRDDSDSISGIMLCRGGTGEIGYISLNGTYGMEIGSGDSSVQGNVFFNNAHTTLVSESLLGLYTHVFSRLKLEYDAGYNELSFAGISTTNNVGTTNAYFGLSNGKTCINSSNFKVADDATNKFSAYSQTIDVTTSTSPEKVSDYFTSISGGSISHVTIHTFGAIVCMTIIYANSGTKNAGDDILTATLSNTTLRPTTASVNGSSYVGQHALIAKLETNGKLTIRNASSTTYSGTGNLVLSLTYVRGSGTLWS